MAFTSPRHVFMHVLRTRLNELPNRSSNDPRPQRRVKYERHFVPLLHRIRLRVDQTMRLLKEEEEKAEKGSSIWGVKSLSDHQTIPAFSLYALHLDIEISLDGYCNDTLSRSIRITCAIDTNKRRRQQ